MPILTTDSLQTTDPGFNFPDAETWIVRNDVELSSIYSIGALLGYEGGALVNHGTILSAKPSLSEGIGKGVWIGANDCSITNAADGTIFGVVNGIFLQSEHPTIANQGTVQSFDTAIDCTSYAFGLGLDNSGTITGRFIGIRYAAFSGLGVVSNSGVIRGDEFGIFYDGYPFGVTGTLKIVNAAGGTIVGQAAAIAVRDIDAGRIILTNHGTITGDVYIGESKVQNVVINGGAIRGDVILSDGPDFFRGIGGRSGEVLGEMGKDTLIGGNAADRLAGGPGSDLLTGHGGRDSFIFDAALNQATNTDKITDFQPGIDKIILFQPVFAAAGSPGTLGAARFHIGGAAADALDRVIYNPTTGALFYDHDGRGGDAQVKFAQLAPHIALHHSDFLVGA